MWDSENGQQKLLLRREQNTELSVLYMQAAKFSTEKVVT